MTYQRNMSRALQEVLDEEVEERVERAEVGGGDGDEEDRHPGGLDQRRAVGPLDSLELGPAGDEEPDDPPPLTLRRGLAALAALLRLLRAAPALALGGLAGAAGDPVRRLLGHLDHGGLGPADVRARWSRRGGLGGSLLDGRRLRRGGLRGRRRAIAALGQS